MPDTFTAPSDPAPAPPQVSRSGPSRLPLFPGWGGAEAEKPFPSLLDLERDDHRDHVEHDVDEQGFVFQQQSVAAIQPGGIYPILGL
jgi:hypothetical protein